MNLNKYVSVTSSKSCCNLVIICSFLLNVASNSVVLNSMW